MGSGFRDRMGRAELLRLRHVDDTRMELLAVLEVGLDPLPAVSDDEDQVPDAVLDEGLDDGLEKGTVTDWDHDLGDGRREGTHPGSLPGRQDDRLHGCRASGGFPRDALFLAPVL